MATNMNVSIRYSSFLPVLIEAMRLTEGDVLELGAGVFSTPLLHWLCQKQKRFLTTIENDEKWFNFSRQYYKGNKSKIHHRFIFAKNWDSISKYITKPWDVALIDHSPSARRIVEIEKLKNLAKYIVIHDADAHKERNYHYSKIIPFFKYQYYFTEVEPATMVLSNLINLKNFRA